MYPKQAKPAAQIAARNRPTPLILAIMRYASARKREENQAIVGEEKAMRIVVETVQFAGNSVNRDLAPEPQSVCKVDHPQCKEGKCLKEPASPDARNPEIVAHGVIHSVRAVRRF